MESESIQSRRARTVFLRKPAIIRRHDRRGYSTRGCGGFHGATPHQARAVGREGRWSAFVSRADLLRALASAVRTLAATSRTDADIRQYVLSIACRSGV